MRQALAQQPTGSQVSKPPAPNTPGRAQAYAWAVVGLLWVVACLNYLDRLMLVSMRESVKADIAMTEAQFGLAGIVYALLLLAFLRGGGTAASAAVPVQARDCRWFEALKTLFGQASFFALLTYLSLAALAAWGITGWLPTFLREGFLLSQGRAGLAATGYEQLGSCVGVLAGGALSDVWVRTNTRARLYVVLIGFCMGGPALSLVAGTHVFAWAVAGMLLYGIGRGFSDANVMPILCQVANPKYRATGYGFLNLFSTFTGGAMI